MKNYHLCCIFLIAVLTMISSCSKDNAGGSVVTDPCAGIIVTVTAAITSANTGQSNGSINAAAGGGAGITFSLNGGAFQVSGLFSNLAANTYTVTAKTSAGCVGSSQFIVGTINACTGVTITVSATTTNATPCISPANGSVTVNAAGSTGFTYSLNSGTFQSSNLFNNLVAGSYSIIAKDANGCSQSASATVAVTAPGVMYAAVKQVMLSFCALSGCHLSPNPQNGLDFNLDCTIIANSGRIKARAVDGNPSFMPPPPASQLSSANKQKIVDWINAGGGYNN